MDRLVSFPLIHLPLYKCYIKMHYMRFEYQLEMDTLLKHRAGNESADFSTLQAMEKPSP